MKITKIPLRDDNVAMLTKMAKVEPSTDEEGNSMGLEDFEDGTYALDSQGRIWRLCETMTELIQVLQPRR